MHHTIQQMASLKDTIKLKEEGLKVGLQEAGMSFGGFFSDFPRRKRKLLLGLVIAIIPATTGTRYGVQALAAWRLQQHAALAHPSYSEAQPPRTGAVQILEGQGNIYSVYAEIENPNVDLAAPAVSYRLSLYNSRRETIIERTGTMFLLPNQKKYVVLPRVDSTETLVSGVLTLQQFKWQKQFTLPEVEIKAAPPTLYNETNPLELVAEGALVNDSPYRVRAVRLVFLLTNTRGQVIAVSQREEFDVSPFARRSYKQFFPGLYREAVAKVQVFADTNTLDSSNIILEETE
jgi:hypothetical protein